MELIFLSVSFLASVIGSLCGIGGGIIIKPTLDFLKIMSVESISFLSGSTVLSMTLVSILRNKISDSKLKDAGEDASKINLTIVIPLAIGAIIGGLLGKRLFVVIKLLMGNESFIGFVQSIIMSIITLITILILQYIKRGHKFKTIYKNNFFQTVLLGFVLGIISSFLGIGGGPINIIVLTIFFLMDAREAAINNLYIIMFSQLSSLLYSIITKSIPEYDLITLALMIAGGILGGLIGSQLRTKTSNESVQKLFSLLMVLVLIINIVNSVKFFSF